jgi:glucose-6-phosphate dehydrogenase assembly protein OpcA
MAPDVKPSLERLIDHFMPVEPANIEAEFDRIWQDVSSGPDNSSVRLRVSNFLAWGTEAEASERFERIMETLAQRHPCRGMLAVTAVDAKDIEASISAHCWRTASGGRHICSEEILLRAGPRNESRLASAVLALLVPELPVHLWMPGDPVALQRLPEELLHVVDRMYADAGAAGSPEASLRALMGLVAEPEPVFVDLAWQRGRVWRDLVAQLFDGPAPRGELDRLQRIRIEGGADCISAEALLLAGWLASRLDFSTASVSRSGVEIAATYYDGSRGVGIELAPSTVELPLGLISLTTPASEFLVELHAESGHLHVRSTLEAEPVHRTVAPEADDDVSVLSTALDDVSDPSVYLEALHAAVAMLDS